MQVNVQSECTINENFLFIFIICEYGVLRKQDLKA